MNYLIIDDEPITHQIIETYAAELPFLRLVGTCFDAIQAMEWLGQPQGQPEPVDLVFLDIEMPKLAGFDFLRTIARPPPVIVISAHKEYALEGYELNVRDYLLKPFDFERFLKAVNRARAGMAEHRIDGEPALHETIFIKDGKKHHQVRLDEVIYVEACGNYCQVHLTTRKILTQEKISDLAARLPDVFLRVHKSFIVATRRIDVIEGGELRVAERRIPIGRTYKSHIINLLKARST